MDKFCQEQILLQQQQLFLLDFVCGTLLTLTPLSLGVVKLQSIKLCCLCKSKQLPFRSLPSQKKKIAAFQFSSSNTNRFKTFSFPSQISSLAPTTLPTSLMRGPRISIDIIGFTLQMLGRKEKRYDGELDQQGVCLKGLRWLWGL